MYLSSFLMRKQRILKLREGLNQLFELFLSLCHLRRKKASGESPVSCPVFGRA
jgi:hypothetical protein